MAAWLHPEGATVELGFIATGTYEVLRAKAIAADDPVSVAHTADYVPSFVPGPDRAIAVHVVLRLPWMIHNRVVRFPGSQHDARVLSRHAVQRRLGRVRHTCQNETETMDIER